MTQSNYAMSSNAAKAAANAKTDQPSQNVAQEHANATAPVVQGTEQSKTTTATTGNGDAAAQSTGPDKTVDIRCCAPGECKAPSLQLSAEAGTGHTCTHCGGRFHGLCGVDGDMTDCGCRRHAELQQVQSALSMDKDSIQARFDILFLQGQWPLSLLQAATDVTVARWYGECHPGSLSTTRGSWFQSKCPDLPDLLAMTWQQNLSSMLETNHERKRLEDSGPRCDWLDKGMHKAALGGLGSGQNVVGMQRLHEMLQHPNFRRRCIFVAQALQDGSIGTNAASQKLTDGTFKLPGRADYAETHAYRSMLLSQGLKMPCTEFQSFGCGFGQTHISLLKEVAVNISEFCELVELELDLGSISFFFAPT